MKQVRAKLWDEIFKVSGLGHDHRWKHWIKEVAKVDTSKSDGYAFEGPFVKDGTVEIEIKPTLYLVASETGSAKYHSCDYRVVAMDAQGDLSKTEIGTDGEPGWALRIRDQVAALLKSISETPAAPTLREAVEELLREASDSDLEAVKSLLEERKAKAGQQTLKDLLISGGCGL